MCCFSTLLYVFFVRTAILSCVFLNNLVICLLYHSMQKWPILFFDGFGLPVCFVYVCLFCLYGIGFVSKFILYPFFCRMFLLCFFSVLIL
jgi:hypothetical protein